MTVTQLQASPEQLGHPPRETDGSPRRGGRHPVGAAQQVVEALLVPGVLELVVRRPAVVDHGAVVVEAQDGLGHGTAARRVDDVSGGLRADQGVQPRGVSAHAPAGLIGHHPVGLSHGLTNGLVDRLATTSGPQDGVDAATATELDTKQALQAARDLAVRQATLFVEFDDGSLGIWPQLGGSSAESIGRLQGMASLNAAMALTTLADMNVELPMNGLAWDLHLELLGDVRFVEGSAAVRADGGQGRLLDFV